VVLLEATPSLGFLGFFEVSCSVFVFAVSFFALLSGKENTKHKLSINGKQGSSFIRLIGFFIFYFLIEGEAASIQSYD